MMSQDVYYRDIAILPGEDRVMIGSGLFRALHGHQKGHAAQLVLVPFTLQRGREAEIIKTGQIFDGIRVFSNHDETLASINLNPMIDDAVKMRRIVCADASHADKHIRVRRIHVPTHSAISRYERRKDQHAKHVPDQVADAINRRRLERSRPGVHFWMQKDGVKYPFFISVSVHDEHAHFNAINTYGCGDVPLIDF